MKEIAKSTGTFKSFDGTPIYYESHGEGQPIIFVYGICCLINHWHFQVAHFSQNYRVLVFDIRGHHQSATPKDLKNLTIASISEDLVGLLDHLQIEKAHVVGHSFGVPVLIDFASKNPSRVRSLAFVNGFAQNPIKNMFGLQFAEPLYYFVKRQYALAPALWNELWKVTTNNPLAMWITGFAGGFNVKLTQFKDIEIYMRGVSQVSLAVFLPMFEDLMSFDGSNMLRGLQFPTLILSGEQDAVTPVRFQEDMHRYVSGSVFVRVPYGSHCTQLDFPDYVNLKLDQHLRRANGLEEEA